MYRLAHEEHVRLTADVRALLVPFNAANQQQSSGELDHGEAKQIGTNARQDCVSAGERALAVLAPEFLKLFPDLLSKVNPKCLLIMDNNRGSHHEQLQFTLQAFFEVVPALSDNTNDLDLVTGLADINQIVQENNGDRAGQGANRQALDFFLDLDLLEVPADTADFLKGAGVTTQLPGTNARDCDVILLLRVTLDLESVLTAFAAKLFG